MGFLKDLIWGKGTTLKLSAEERFEVKQALEAFVRLEQAAIERWDEAPAMNAPGGVVERTEYSNNILMAVIRRLGN